MGKIQGLAIRWVCLAALVGGLGLVESAHAAPTTLRWKFKAGEVLRYESAQTTVSRFKQPDGPEVTQTLTLTLDLTWKVKEVDPQGVASLTQTIDRIRTTATMPFGKFSFDSKENGDASSPAGPIFKMLTGAEFLFKMNPKGELSDIQLSEKLVNSLRTDKDTPGAQGQFSEAGLKNMLVQMGLVFADEALDTGKTWNRKLAIPAGPGGETRDIEQLYTYTGPETSGKPLEVVTMATTFQPVAPDPNVPVKIKSQEATGRYLFDNESGRISTSTVTEKVDLTGEVQGATITQSNETTTVLTLQAAPTP